MCVMKLLLCGCLYLLRKPAVGCCVTTVSFEATIFSYGGANGGGALDMKKLIKNVNVQVENFRDEVIKNLRMQVVKSSKL